MFDFFALFLTPELTIMLKMYAIDLRSAQVKRTGKNGRLRLTRIVSCNSQLHNPAPPLGSDAGIVSDAKKSSFLET